MRDDELKAIIDFDPITDFKPDNPFVKIAEGAAETATD